MTQTSDGYRTVVFNADVTDSQGIDELHTAKTHSHQAVNTYMSYQTELRDLAAEVSHATRLVPIQRFVAFVQADDIDERRDRYAALRTAEMLAYAMGKVPSKPLRFLVPPNEPGATNRPLRPLEIGLARLIAHSRKLRKGTVNLAVLDAGGSAGDLPHMTPDRVEINGKAGEFHLPETARSMARTVPIPEWAVPRVTKERQKAVKDGRNGWSIGYKKWKTHLDDVQSAGLMTIKPILDHAGLRFDGTVTPSSIRNARALEVFAVGGIFEAAQVLGSRSLDQAAAAIGLQHA